MPLFTPPTPTPAPTPPAPSLASQAEGLVLTPQTPAAGPDACGACGPAEDEVKPLADSMSERDSVDWACQSSRKVEGQSAPEDTEALEAAEKWVQNPSPATQADAAAAAARTDYQGPGAWAAQGAAWSQSPAGTAPAAGNTGSAVAGSVNLAAAISSKTFVPASAALPAAPVAPAAPTLAAPAAEALTVAEPAAPTPEIPPNVLTQKADALKPFLDLGKSIAGGQHSWV